ncbi:fasciclin domain-containing protein [Citricoccus nitrophenolicus]|uniref:Putative surface protein with fasciclin (FAS1) repeats n=1 Tax=Citricoccus muralis TaxID=169134 RepID=A0A3D9LDI3_9MICC|nr:fasciclin domain-containing protein [Citricoccus muralis]REE04428.1 putative surface protein with fasciclin (FAS1) repeats [Citricoccus muralis]
MKTTMRNTMLGLFAVTALGLTACGGAADEPASSSAAASSESSMSSPSMEESMESGSGSASASESMMDPAANLVGPGCAAYAEEVPDGAGSVEGMAMDPVAVAASNNPMLTTLTSAVSGELNPDVNLVDTLNGDEFTVFAPVDDAFAAIPEADLNAVVEDADMLSSVLTYHVVPGQISPDEIAGTHTTVQGEDLEVAGSGDELTVNDANVICGGVQTANATVYLVDAVLMPAMD